MDPIVAAAGAVDRPTRIQNVYSSQSSQSNQNGANGAKQATIRQAAQGLEAELLRQMLHAMQRAQLENGLFGASAGSGARQTAFEMLLTQQLAALEPLGLAAQIEQQLAGRIGAVQPLPATRPAGLSPALIMAVSPEIQPIGK